LRAEWFAGAETVGLTAGTSTPDTTIDAVEEALWRLVKGREHSRFSSPSKSLLLKQAA
jgi:4-hydroxy-3-methylbut-2-enyl diphosphate reductase IspH